MNVKTMEGLAGASASMSLISTPMSVAKEAERKGDTDKMQRALGYAAGLKDQTEEYGKKAEKGMKADAREAKEKDKLRQEKLIEARRKEREEQEKRLREEAGKVETGQFDSAKISPEGKIQAKAAENAAADSSDPVEDVVYDESGECTDMAEKTGENVDVSV